MKTLYPEITPFNTFLLETGSTHQVYVEQCGNPQGVPVIFLHGGPCSGCKPDHRRFFNPTHYHIVLMDQRGCGRSMPFGALQHNTADDLVEDIERIRQRLQIDRWVLFGGSWGGTLALLYAQRYPQLVAGMIIRGVFLARQKDMDWFLKEGAGRIYPERWECLVASLGRPPDDLLKAIGRIIFGGDEVAQRRVTRAWMAWGAQTALGPAFQDETDDLHITEKMVKQTQMEIHFAVNRYFVDDNQILHGCGELQHIPTWIIHGRNDLVCPVECGFSLARALPEATFTVLPNAGHVAQGDEMIDALVSSTDGMLEQID